MTALVQAVSPRSSFSLLFRETAEVITQTVVRILFVAGFILMTAYTIPLAWHAVVIPVVAFSATWLAATFFPQTESLVPYFEPLPDLIAPIKLLLPVHAPEGLVNINQNCAFNSVFHILESDPQSGNDFLQRRDSQQLRIALSQISSSIDPSPEVQTDAGEIWSLILNSMPDAQKIKIEITYYPDMKNLPPMKEEMLPKQEVTGLITLELDETTHTLNQLLHKYMNPEKVDEPYKALGTDGKEHLYPLERSTLRFLNPPPALRLQIKRFKAERPAETVLNRALPGGFPRGGWRIVKNGAPIEVPNELEVEGKKYRLASFINHLGENCDGGHYIAAREVEGQKYFINDRAVTLANPSEWERQVQKAYLLCYVPA